MSTAEKEPTMADLMKALTGMQKTITQQGKELQGIRNEQTQQGRDLQGIQGAQDQQGQALQQLQAGGGAPLENPPQNQGNPQQQQLNPQLGNRLRPLDINGVLKLPAKATTLQYREWLTSWELFAVRQRVATYPAEEQRVLGRPPVVGQHCRNMQSLLGCHVGELGHHWNIRQGSAFCSMRS